MAAETAQFRVMGCDARVVLVDPGPHAMELAIDELHEFDRRWTRFHHDSELSMLNLADGDWVDASSATMTLLATMQSAHALTGGAFDPTFLYEVIETGYGQSRDEPSRRSIVVDLPCPGQSVDDAELDRHRSRIRLPAGLALDAGGIGKGLAADLVAATILDGGTAGALVSIGGDMTVAGRPPHAEGWTIDVEDPFEPGAALTRLTVSGGGIATSCTRRRRSISEGVSRHHTIDPRTRQSAATDLAAVTVVAPTGWEAEAHATAILLGGGENAAAYAHRRGLSGLAVRDDRTEFRFGALVKGDPSMAGARP